jgi:hypothetical protein
MFCPFERHSVVDDNPRAVCTYADNSCTNKNRPASPTRRETPVSPLDR